MNLQAVRSLTLKRSVLAVTTAAVLIGGAVGVAGAQQATPTPGSQQVTPTPGGRAGDAMARRETMLSTLASKLGVSVDKLKQAFEETRKELGVPQNGPGFHRGPGGPGGQGGPGGVGGFIRRGFGGLEAAAKAMNITTDVLRQELPGKSLSDVAKAHNVDPKVVADALKAEAATRIDQAVTAGRLTAEQAATLKQRETERVDQLMTRQTPTIQPGQPGQPGRPGQPGPRGRAADALPAGANA
jgi:hypothetical protein